MFTVFNFLRNCQTVGSAAAAGPAGASYVRANSQPQVKCGTSYWTVRLLQEKLGNLTTSDFRCFGKTILGALYIVKC